MSTNLAANAANVAALGATTVAPQEILLHTAEHQDLQPS